MANVNSPCVRNCCLNDDDICLGCFRSLEEIVGWGGASDERKQEIIQLAKARGAERDRKYRLKHAEKK